MHAKIFFIALGLLILANPFKAQGATPQELLQQIAQIQSQIVALQSQLAQLKVAEPFSSFQQTLQMTDQNTEVKKLQEILKQEGLFCAKCQITGYFGWWTKAGLMNFQKRYGLPITGTVNDQTKAKLNQYAGVSATQPTQQPQPQQQTPTSPAPPPSPLQQDSISPSFSIVINDGAASTNNQDVVIRVDCKDPSGGEAMRFSNFSAFTNESWGGAEAGKLWRLSSGDGLKTVYAQCQDAKGNIANASDSISLDALSPVTSVSGPTGTLAAGTTQATLSLTTNEQATCRYAAVPNTDYDAMNTGNTFSGANSTSHSIIVSTLSPGSYSFYVRCKDAGGNKNLFDTTISFSVASPTNPALTLTNYNMNVLVLKYFPLTADKNNIDIAITGDVGDSYSSIWQKTIDITNNLKTALERSSAYLGYKNSSAQPSLNYNILEVKRYEEAVPTKDTPLLRYPDYQQILTRENICSYVDQQNVQEVWLFAYQGPTKADGAPFLNIFESKMSGPHGDISNSWGYNDMPLCSKTYRLYVFNYGRMTTEALEAWGHQMEAELDAIDSTLFRGIFQGPNYPQTQSVIGRCGSVHNPPNAKEEYDRTNATSQQSDCLDWTPDSVGSISQISCANWGCQDISDSNNPHLNYQIWNWQNLPGRNNTKTYKSRQLRNWWDVHGDFDNVMSSSRRLTTE